MNFEETGMQLKFVVSTSFQNAHRDAWCSGHDTFTKAQQELEALCYPHNQNVAIYEIRAAELTPKPDLPRWWTWRSDDGWHEILPEDSHMQRPLATKHNNGHIELCFQSTLEERASIFRKLVDTVLAMGN